MRHARLTNRTASSSLFMQPGKLETAMTDTLTESAQQYSRSETRNPVDRFHSLELSIEGIDPVYQFKLWNISSSGMCILVREDSAIIGHIKQGDVFQAKYYPAEALEAAQLLKTEVKHITKDDEGRFRGHYKVGLAILEKQNGDES